MFLPAKYVRNNVPNRSLKGIGSRAIKIKNVASTAIPFPNTLTGIFRKLTVETLIQFKVVQPVAKQYVLCTLFTEEVAIGKNPAVF